MPAMKVYLAGPLAMQKFLDFNFPAFTNAAERLRKIGYTVYSPAEDEINKGYDAHGHDGDLKKFTEKTGFNLRKALKRDLKWICAHADMVVMLPGWENSKGSRAEVATATALGLPVIPIEKALLKHPPYKDDYLIIDPLRLAFRDLGSITDVDRHLDENVGQRYKNQSLAQDWARVAKVCEEAGEVIQAYINYTGQNPRKGECGTLREVLLTLGDTALSAIFGIQHFTQNAETTAEVLEEQLQKAVGRIKASHPVGGAISCSQP